MSDYTEETERFGFQAGRATGRTARRLPEGGYGYSTEPQWNVWLPHQCDSWEIAGVEYGDGQPTKAEALADLDAFIAEAQETRRRLDAEEWETP